MSYSPRNYEDIVRDLLTTLTGGTVRETLTAPPGDGPIVLEELRDRPVRRVSHLEGLTAVGTGANVREIPYRFTTADFELVSTTGDENGKDAIRFRVDGRRPVPGSTLTVNYYPVQTDPVPLTDLNVGSVTRTLMETFARELALSHLHLEHIYKSAFLETAEGSSLEKVVALVGIQRLPSGHPVANVRFSRRANTPGTITVPPGTALTDAAGNRYLTLNSLTLQPGETTREVLAGGEGPGTEPVEQAKLNRPEVMIAGISEVTNPQPARRLSSPETDDELRRRARGALHGVVRGTLDALRFGLLSIPEVKDVAIEEAPNGVYGEIEVTVAYNNTGSPEVRGVVERTIEELKPAGIRALLGEAASRRLNVRVELTLAGTGLPPASEVTQLTNAIESRLADHLSSIPPGGKVRRAQLTSLVLSDARVVDARVVLLPDGEGESEELQLNPGETLAIVRPFTFSTVAETTAAQPAVTTRISVVLPIHLAPGVTAANATEAIELALGGYLASRSPGAALTVDGLAAAIRDETRFALVRSEALVTVETTEGRFQQLTDGVGAYTPGANETLQKGSIDVEVREGNI